MKFRPGQFITFKPEYRHLSDYERWLKAPLHNRFKVSGHSIRDRVLLVWDYENSSQDWLVSAEFVMPATLRHKRRTYETTKP